MAGYTLDFLRSKGIRPLFELLFDQIITQNQPFVTYGEVAAHLEKQLGIDKVFSLHPGKVAGELMDKVREHGHSAPPINAFVTRGHGIPGVGAGPYIDSHLWRRSAGKWNRLPVSEKRKFLVKIRSDVRLYEGWAKVYEDLFGKGLSKSKPKFRFSERDGKPSESGQGRGGGESCEHKRLKDWVAQNPQALNLPEKYRLIGKEHHLLSGDSVDVLFGCDDGFVPVEVKSIWSSDDDHKRGIYQCVKYREVLCAQELPAMPKVRAILVTELSLNRSLMDTAKRVDVQHFQVTINSGAGGRNG